MGNGVEGFSGGGPLGELGVVAEEFAAALSERGWLSRTPADFRIAVISASQTVHRAAGQQIYFVGDDLGGMFGVCSGAIEIATPLGNPDANVVHLGQPGLWIGAGPALTGAPRRISISARTDVVLAHLSLAAIQRMVGNRPEWWRHIGALAIENMQTAIGAAADLLIRDNQRRCIAVLLRLCGARYEDPVSESSLTTPVSQEELASMTHLSRNAVGAVVRRLAAQHLIELRYRAIHLCAPDTLRGMVDAPAEI